MERLVLTEKKEWGALLTLNRPKALNALNEALLQELDEALCALQEEARVIVITGSGEKAFAAGADISAMQAMSPKEAQHFSRAGQAVMNRIANLRPIVIAAVNGYALGGGCELAMACDIRIASEKARFGIPEVTLGVIPGFGGTQRLTRLVGTGRALELLATGANVKAEEALRIGLVNRVTEPENLMHVCEEMAQKIAGNSTGAIALGKQSILEGAEMDLQKALTHEASLFALTFAEADQKEGMSAFLEKRKATFQ